MVTVNGNSVGVVATYTCDLGFELIGNTTTICTLLNMSSAEFQPAAPSCRREYAKFLRIASGHFRFHMSIFVASLVHLHHSQVNHLLCIICNSYCLVTFNESCSVALCDDPVDIDNGTITFNGIVIGDVATYTCDLGFELIGDATTTCTLVDRDSAEFQPALPSCRRKYTE